MMSISKGKLGLTGLSFVGLLGLSGCGFFDSGDILPRKDVSRGTVKNATIIPFQGDYQTAHDSVVRNAKTCFSSGNQVVKALQITDGAPAQIDVFDRGTSPAEPLPKDLRVKAFMKPNQGGGEVKLESFSTNPTYGHERNVKRFSAWLADQSEC